MSAAALCVTDQTDALYGPPGTVISGATTVFVGPLTRMAAQAGSPVSTHGNPAIPTSAGFNPACAAATILAGSSTVFVENLPMASMDNNSCSCGFHHVISPTEPTVIVGP